MGIMQLIAYLLPLGLPCIYRYSSSSLLKHLYYLDFLSRKGNLVLWGLFSPIDWDPILIGILSIMGFVP
jgi:hypothetical protein